MTTIANMYIACHPHYSYVGCVNAIDYALECCSSHFCILYISQSGEWYSYQ